MNTMNSDVSKFISTRTSLKEAYEKARNIILQTELEEDFKWYAPCYTYNGSNVILLGGFKEFFVISFVKGILLKDANKVLIQQGENTRSTRVMKFTNADQIDNLELIIKKYIAESIENEKAGIKVDFEKNSELVFPEELINEFEVNPEFKDAFESLSKGRQRAYNLYFSGAKQSTTRQTRIEKYKDKILNGKGMDD